jgi:hypothetical protein
MAESDDRQELSIRAGNQAGWTLPLFGEERCVNYGHELENRAEYTNGLIVGYCIRCSARVEIPWFRGGTISALAKAMTEEARGFTQPAQSVMTDLNHVINLVNEDLAALNKRRQELEDVRRQVGGRLR